MIIINVPTLWLIFFTLFMVSVDNTFNFNVVTFNNLFFVVSVFWFSFSFFFSLSFWLCWVFIAACGLSLFVVSRGYSLLQCTGFSLQWPLLLRSTGARRAGFGSCGTRALGHVGFSSCGMWAQ